ILDNINSVPDATKTDRETIKGELLALRAFSYHMLVQLFGPRYEFNDPIKNQEKLAVPLVLNYTLLPVELSSVAAIYDQINIDLATAIDSLDGKSINGIYRTRIDKSIALGLKARVSMSQG